MLQDILVAIDGSESSDRALDVALDMAWKFSAKLVLINVFSPVTALSKVSYPTTEIEFTPKAMATYYTEIKESHESMLEAALKKAKKVRPDLDISAKLVEGHPASKIVEMAKEGNCDMIIIGHRGLSGIREFFLGSVSHRVSHDAECSVLIVK